MSNEDITQISVDEILNEAIDATNGEVTYVTHIRLRVTNNDVTLDSYYVGPNIKDPNGKPSAYLRNRLVLPVGLAKDISNLLSTAMANWEETFGVNLPIVPLNEENADE